MRKKFKSKEQVLREEKVYKIQLFEQPFDEEKRYVRSTHYMLHHKSFLSLSMSAKTALLYVRDWGMASKSYLETGKFEYSSSMLSSKGLMSQKTAIKALDELVKKGFLKREYKHGVGSINRYSFSSSWYTGIQDNDVVVDEYVSVKNKP